MSIREVMIDGSLAQDAEAIADMLGYDNLDNFINSVLADKVNEVNQSAAVARAVYHNQSNQQ
jgi:hypothetical protein